MLKPESNSNSKKSENCIKIYQDIVLKENWSSEKESYYSINNKYVNRGLRTQ